MADHTDTASLRRVARVAGLCYLGMALTGPVALLVVPSQVFVAGDPAATAAQVVAQEGLVRLGVLAGVICQVCYVLTALALDRLFVEQSALLRRILLALVVAGAPLGIGTELFSLAAIELAHGQTPALAYTALQLHEHGVTLASVFWGLWLLPFGALVVRSARVPSWLGWLLVLGGVAYLVDSTLGILWPDLRAALTDVLLLPLAAGELSMIGWLLVRGVRDPS